MGLDLAIDVVGEIVEQQELLNGTRTVTLSGASADGVWALDGVLSWNRGLLEYTGEGDLTLVRGDGAELYATLMGAAVRGEVQEDESDVSLAVTYQVDGGTAEFDGASGTITGVVRLVASAFEGRWTGGVIAGQEA